MPAKPAQLSATAKAVYSLPGMALAVCGAPLYVYMPKFYTDVMGVSAAMVGGVILSARLLDALSDPLAGVLSDRTRSPFGRRRPFIALGSLLLAGLLVAIFAPPSFSQAAMGLWFGGVLLLLSVAWTLVDVPWEALGPDICRGYDERSTLFSLREGAAVVGLLLAMAAPLAIEHGLHLGDSATDQRLKFAVFGIGSAVFLVLSCWLCVWRIRERQTPLQQTAQSRFWQGWRETLANRPFRVLLMAYAVAAIGANLPATLILYYVAYVLGGGQAEFFLLLYVATGIAFLPLWLLLARRNDKKPAWIGAMLLQTGAFLGVFFLGTGDQTAFAVLTVLSGAGFGASLALPAAMQADVIDYDELLSGQRREGRYIGLWAVAKKAASALGLGLALPTLDLLGYQPGQEQSAQVTLALRVLYCLVPCLCSLAAAGIVLFYPLSRSRHQAVLQAMAKRREGRSVNDPLAPNVILKPLAGGA